jgi:hypothetical protein
VSTRTKLGLRESEGRVPLGEVGTADPVSARLGFWGGMWAAAMAIGFLLAVVIGALLFPRRSGPATRPPPPSITLWRGRWGRSSRC